MTLIKSISGIRGTIGGIAGDGLSPLDLVKFTSAFGQWLINRNNKKKISVVLGRDARISGEMVEMIVAGTLSGMGIDVINLGMATTPTVEIAVPDMHAAGGIILTASHNPKQWNALKLLHEKGEFLSDKEGKEVLAIADNNRYTYAAVDDLGSITPNHRYNDIHIDKILRLKEVDTNAIRERHFSIVVDAVNSVGGIVIPKLLKALGVANVIELYCEPTGLFPHNPEPLPEHLTEIAALVKEKKADLGVVVDPDVDRLALVCEDGSMFGEEYTLVAVADYILSLKKGNTVSNLSSSRALRDITEQQGGNYFASAVGEVNVVTEMKRVNAVIGGEGNGGIIYPPLHYGRDALVGVALFLSHLAKSSKKCSDLRATYPSYVISKNKMELKPSINIDELLLKIKTFYAGQEMTDIDGLKIFFGKEWVHLRKSNTEPIIRIYSESNTKEQADKLAQNMIEQIKQIVN